MKELKYKFIPILASIFSVTAFSFLTFSIHTTRKTDDLNYIILFLILSAQLLLFLNGIINDAIHIYIPSIIIICFLTYIIYIKVNNEA